MSRSAPLRVPRQERSRRTLDEMVRAAGELLRERPYDEVGVDEIVERAGCTKGAFYHRFADKASLLHHLNGRLFEQASADWDAFLAPERWSGRPLRDILEAFIERVVAIYRRRGHLMGAFIYQARWKRDETVRARAAQLHSRVLDGLLRLVRSRSNELAPHVRHDPEAALDFWLGACAAVVAQAVLFGDEGTRGSAPGPERVEREVKRLFVPYLVGERGRAG